MGDMLAGLGLAVLAFLIFQISGMFSRYPAKTDGKPARAFFWMRWVSYLLFTAGVIVILIGLF